MRTVLVTGGTGTFGKPLVARLREQGDDVRVLSRRAGAGTHVGDLRSGAGVAEAAQGADVIVHAASDTRRFGRGDQEQTEHLLASVRDAKHLLYVSIVGIDRIPFAYYRRKLACERRIMESGVPYTILRATQFHELIALVLGGVERLPIAPLPLDFRFQPVAAAEVAELAAELAHREPSRTIVNFGGPEVLALGRMVDVWRTSRGRPRRIMPLPALGKVAHAFREGRNTCPGEAAGRQTWSEFAASWGGGGSG